MGRRVDMKTCMLDRKVRVLVNSVRATDNEAFNSLHDVVETARSSLRAYRDLLVESDASFARMRAAARRHAVPFSPATFPSDIAGPAALRASLALARDAILSAPPAPRAHRRSSVEVAAAASVVAGARKRASGDAEEKETGGTGVEAAHDVAIRLVDEYLRALQRCSNVQCASVMVSYRNVVRHRETGRELASRREAGTPVARGAEREIVCANELAVSNDNYAIALARVLAPLQALCDKRFVVFKAVRIAFYAAQLRSFDVLADSLVHTAGEGEAAGGLAGIDVASRRMHDHVALYVSKLAVISIESVEPDVVAEFKPAACAEDDAVAAALAALPDPVPPPEPETLAPPASSEASLPTPAPRALELGGLLKGKRAPASPVPDETAPTASKVRALSSNKTSDKPVPASTETTQTTLEKVTELALDSKKSEIAAGKEEKSSSGRISARTSSEKMESVSSAGKTSEGAKTPKKRMFLFKRRVFDGDASATTTPKANTAASPKSVVQSATEEEATPPPPKRTLSVEMLVRKFEPLKS